MFRRQVSASLPSASSPASSTTPASLRRAKSNHSFSSPGSGTIPTNALGGSSARGWYLEDDEEEGFGDRRTRSNSLTSLGSGIVSSPLPKTISNSSLVMMSATGGLGALARSGSCSVSSSSSSSSSVTRSLFSSTRRWSSLLRGMEHLWEGEGGRGGGMEMSPQDTDRSYRLIRLPNNLKAIVVSDPTTEKAAAALSVRVGAKHDPAEAPGLAHFCEHMLFLGTEKYPRENTYKDLVSKSGGSSNASTSMDLTLYKFESSADAFEDVLDVFAQFFISPLFTESATARELKAVDSENSKNLIADSRRLLQITKAVAEPSHPWAKFSTGNLQTLTRPGFDTRRALLALYEEHYHASNMALALVGRDSLDALEAMVREKFSAIRDREGGGKEGKEDEVAFHNPFPPRFMPVMSSINGGKPNGSGSSSSSSSSSSRSAAAAATTEPEAAIPLIRIVPLRDKRELRLSWPLPPSRPHYRSPPTRLLSHLFGHEGEGSIFAVLHRIGWASAVHAGLGTSQEEFCLFECTVALTEEGHRHWQDVASLVFQYAHLIGQAPPEDLSAMWNELRVISSTSFRFQQKAQEYAYAPDLARRLQHFKDRHILSGGHLYDSLDVTALGDCLAGMSEEKALLFLICKENEQEQHQQPPSSSSSSSSSTTLMEPWYQIPYTLTLLPSHTLRSWTCAHVDSLHLPRPNPFIAEDFDILSPLSSYEPPSATPSPPTRVLQSPSVEVWHKIDRSYRQPRAYIVLEFASPAVQRDPGAAELLVGYVEHALQESTYDALVAGLGWSVGTSNNGLTLRFSGFSHKIQTLLHKVLESLLSLSLHEGLFALIKEKQIDAYNNIALARPDEHGQMFLSLLLTEGRWAWRDKLRRVQGMEMGDLASFHKEMLGRQNSVKVGVFGNVSEESALGIGEQVERLLRRNGRFEPLSPSVQPHTRVAMLEKGIEYRLRAPVPNETDVNSSLTTYFQAGLVSPSQTASLMLLAQIMKEPCFTQLRTQEQLGYVVASGVRLTWFRSLVAGISFRVLSKTHGPEEILKRLEAFLWQFRSLLSSLPPVELEKHKKALITNLLEPPKKLVGQAGMHWGEIVNETREWKRNRLYVEGVEGARQEDLERVFGEMCLGEGTEGRRSLSVMMYGKNHRMVEEGENGGEEGGREGRRVVWLREEDWLAFRTSRPLFPCSPAVLSSKY